MNLFQRRFAVLLCLLAAAAWAKPGPGIMPKRGKGKPKGSFISAALLSRGPQYSDPNAPPTADQVAGDVAQMDPNNPNQIAAQSLGFSQDNCSGNIQSQVDALNAQLAGIQAQLNAILAKVQSDYAHEVACGFGPGAAPCVASWANQAVADAAASLPLAAQAAALGPQLQALQAQAAGCGSGSGSPQVQPPAATLQAAAHRFGFSLPSAAGQGGSASAFGPNSIFNGGSALDQLKMLDAQGEGADWDNSHALGKALGSYASAAQRVEAMGPLVQAGKQVVSDGETYDDPKTQAEAEYLSINYKEMGSKYDALVDQRHQAAEQVADDTVGALGGTVPMLNSTGAPDLPSPMASLADEARDAAREQAEKTLMDKVKDGIVSLSPDGESMKKILNIEDSVQEGTKNVLGKLGDAISQVGSESMASDKVDAVVGAVSQAQSNAGNAAGYRADPPKVDLVGAVLGVFK